jgi:methylthioribose-1-phosphate isomerase
MQVKGKHYRTIWPKEEGVLYPQTIQIIDQTKLPFEFYIRDLETVNDFYIAIKTMEVRGAGLIGAAAGYGMYIAAQEAKRKGENKNLYESLFNTGEKLKSTRPTAVNLEWAVKRQLKNIGIYDSIDDIIGKTYKTATKIADEDAEGCKKIGLSGVNIIENIAHNKKDGCVNILTHCNAGWLAFVDYGTATAPIYEAFNRGVDVHVWVDETRPRNQGANLTAWELREQGIPHTVIVDNVGGHLMQKGLVDMMIVGTDRTTYTGDVCNKIGTYLKALAAKDNNIPFYVAVPTSSFDWDIRDGKEIPIEQRYPEEVRYLQGFCDNRIQNCLIIPEENPVVNYAFDVTPRKLISGLITERGICKANEEEILRLFPEHKK